MVKKKTWTTLSSEIVHQNPWYHVRKDNIVLPNGRDGEYFVVGGRTGVAIIAEDEDDLYIVGQTRYAIDSIYSWELPMGGVDGNDTPLSAAKKELREEAGVVAKNWIDLGYFYPSNCYVAEKCHVFLARDLQVGDQSLEETEDITMKKISTADFTEMIRRNKISDGMTLAAFYKYLLYKESE